MSHRTLTCGALLAALAAPTTAWAGVRVMVDSSCARKGQAATLEESAAALSELSLKVLARVDSSFRMRSSHVEY